MGKKTTNQTFADKMEKLLKHMTYTKHCRNQDEDGYRRSAAMDRYLNFKPFNRVSKSYGYTWKHQTTPPRRSNRMHSCRILPFFAPAGNVPDPIAQTRPDDAVQKYQQAFGETDAVPGTEEERVRRRGRHVSHPAGGPVHLCLPLRGERAAGGCSRRRVAGARRLHRVPSHTDVLPSSLRKRRKQRSLRLAKEKPVDEAWNTHPDATVPGLAAGLHGSHPESVADGSGRLGGEACDALCYDPHLQMTSPSFPVRSPPLDLLDSITPPPTPGCPALTWSSGPTDTLVTLLEMSSQEEPWG